MRMEGLMCLSRMVCFQRFREVSCLIHTLGMMNMIVIEEITPRNLQGSATEILEMGCREALQLVPWYVAHAYYPDLLFDFVSILNKKL